MTNLAASLGSLLPAVVLVWVRGTGDEEREESIELRTRPRAAIFILPLRFDFGAGDGERDDIDLDEEDTRRRFVGFLSSLETVFRERGGGDGEEDTCRFPRPTRPFLCLPGTLAGRTAGLFLPYHFDASLKTLLGSCKTPN